MKHKPYVGEQLALFAIAPTVETRTIIHDPYWDELDTRQNSHSVGAQILNSSNPYKTVGAQVATDTLKTAPQHDTHWIEKYWVERSGNRYWYYRYCWMVGRKKNRLYLGSVDSVLAKRKKADVEIAIADGKLPSEIKDLIRGWKNESPTMPKMQRNNANF
ncbi:MAG: DUF4102 domain-containing protein [Nostoc sp. DedQUE12b]|uniref:DUF4102 domain-containing protein n=1 Tax=Nostoc sp. DedQUE12b TaxID=3075398 RepID=UPI002AD2AC49|nr:DUF4102 domain-containing protein [Nostoc sp. DedQUE12b]MDZ8086501.1 DUF4102 domain-containing protein [Nostoc sp. DedQUE12b]